ncbi:hypothetical protein Tsubulata_013371 [Turnera subulata]|uniref:Uncharacterized protein n=1 Tax=Turnera subulata TaxID=218843 RepID=A0A9Q0G5G6_9ROSI|nr:hypothetical protein Tsubulata_013371 [Turnera subulata]
MAASNDHHCPRYAFPDAGMLSATQHSDHPLASSGMAASFRVFTESMARMQLAELEMLKSREATLREAHKRRTESEAEMTRLMLQTQLQIASLLRLTTRKRKRVDDGGQADKPAVSSSTSIIISDPFL